MLCFKGQYKENENIARRKYFQIVCPIKMYLEYTYKHNSVIKRQITQSKIKDLGLPWWSSG